MPRQLRLRQLPEGHLAAKVACEIMASTSALDVAMWHDTQPAQAARASQGKRSAAYARQIMSWQV